MLPKSGADCLQLQNVRKRLEGKATLSAKVEPLIATVGKMRLTWNAAPKPRSAPLCAARPGTAWPQRNWNDISAGTPSKAAGLNRPDVNAAAQSAPARWSMIGRICDASKKALYQAPSGNKKPPDWLTTFEYAVQLWQEQRGQVVLSLWTLRRCRWL